MRLTSDQEFDLISAGPLMALFAEEISDFEAETIADAARRWLKCPAAFVTTVQEWEVISRAVDAMRYASRRAIVGRAA